MYIVKSNKVEHITFSINLVEHDRENNFHIRSVVFLESSEIVRVQHIAIATVDDRVALFDTFFPHWSASVYFSIEVHFSKNHTSNRTSHRTITNSIVHYVKVVKEFFFNPFENFFTSRLFYTISFNLFRVVVDSNIAIEVHSKKVIESTESFSLSNTRFSSIAILRFVFTSDFFDVV